MGSRSWRWAFHTRAACWRRARGLSNTHDAGYLTFTRCAFPVAVQRSHRTARTLPAAPSKVCRAPQFIHRFNSRASLYFTGRKGSRCLVALAHARWPVNPKLKTRRGYRATELKCRTKKLTFYKLRRLIPRHLYHSIRHGPGRLKTGSLEINRSGAREICISRC